MGQHSVGPDDQRLIRVTIESTCWAIQLCFLLEQSLSNIHLSVRKFVNFSDSFNGISRKLLQSNKMGDQVNKKLSQFGILAVLFLMLFAFQNCEQPGDISGLGSDSLVSALEIPASNDDSGKFQDETVGLLDPRSNLELGGTSPSPSHNSTSGTSSGNAMDSSTSTGSTTSPSGGDSSTGSVDASLTNSEKNSFCHAQKMSVSDFKLSISSIESSQVKNSDVEKSTIRIDEASPIISSEDKKLRFISSQDLTLDMLRIVLNQEGNQIIFKDGTLLDLKTPSAQESGVKIHLDSEVFIQAGKRYELFLDFELSDQIVMEGGKKCLFRPVIKSGRIELSSI